MVKFVQHGAMKARTYQIRFDAENSRFLCKMLICRGVGKLDIIFWTKTVRKLDAGNGHRAPQCASLFFLHKSFLITSVPWYNIPLLVECLLYFTTKLKWNLALMEAT
jgi:hypothetical protein